MLCYDYDLGIVNRKGYIKENEHDIIAIIDKIDDCEHYMKKYYNDIQNIRNKCEFIDDGSIIVKTEITTKEKLVAFFYMYREKLKDFDYCSLFEPCVFECYKNHRHLTLSNCKQTVECVECKNRYNYCKVYKNFIVIKFDSESG